MRRYFFVPDFIIPDVANHQGKPRVLGAVPVGFDKNQDKPLEEDGGKALLPGFRQGLIRAGLLTPQPKA